MNNEERPPARRTIRDATRINFDYNPFMNVFPNVNAGYGIKGLLIQNLPKFHGLQLKEPHFHLDEVYLKCQSMLPVGANVDDVMFRVFHLTLEGNAKEWYMNLPRLAPEFLRSWTNLKNAFSKI